MTSSGANWLENGLPSTSLPSIEIDAVPGVTRTSTSIIACLGADGSSAGLAYGGPLVRRRRTAHAEPRRDLDDRQAVAQGAAAGTRDVRLDHAVGVGAVLAEQLGDARADLARADAGAGGAEVALEVALHRTGRRVAVLAVPRHRARADVVELGRDPRLDRGRPRRILGDQRPQLLLVILAVAHPLA